MKKEKLAQLSYTNQFSVSGLFLSSIGPFGTFL